MLRIWTFNIDLGQPAAPYQDPIISGSLTPTSLITKMCLYNTSVKPRLYKQVQSANATEAGAALFGDVITEIKWNCLGGLRHVLKYPKDSSLR